MLGESLLHYRILEKLGEGGMGVVWKARDTRLDRDVALKVLPADPGADAMRKQRFLREARSASALSHPNIITVFEINEDRGVEFIAMEYVRGQTLAHILRGGGLSVEQAVHYALQIAAALDHAHEAGIVHRDMKPGNIMITPEDRVKVLDFGLAKHYRAAGGAAGTGAEATVTVDLTGAGTTMGTVAYMSPEQSVGDPLDHRSDIFSFGAVFYQMLTGALPFNATTQAGLLRAIHLESPRRASMLRPGIPEECDAIIARAMEKKPEDRYQSMGEVMRALRQLAPGLPSTQELRQREAMATSTVAVPATRIRGPRRYGWVIAGLVAIVAAGGGLYTYRNRPTAPPAATEAALTGTPQELYTAALRLLDRYDQPGNIDQAIRRLDAALKADPNHAASHAALARAYYHRQGQSPDPQWLRLGRESAERAVQLNRDLAAAHLARAIVLNETGKRDEALASVKTAVDLDPANAMGHMWLGHIHLAQGAKPQALAAYQKAVALAPGEWPGLMALGIFYYREGEYEQAAAAWESARRSAPDNMLLLRNLAAAYHMLDRIEEAASSIQRALEIRPTGPLYSNLGTLRFFQGRYADAVAAFEKAVELSANNYLYWGNLGDAYRWTPGRRDKAVETYRRAIELARQRLKTDRDNLELRGSLAVYLVKSGEAKSALTEIGPVESAAKATGSTWFKVLLVQELAGNRERALAALERSLKGGYSQREIKNEPELTALRADARYHKVMTQFAPRQGQ